MSGTEIIFEVSEDELDGGYSASALGFGIHTQGDTLDELRRNVKEAVDCYFDDAMERPRLIRLLIGVRRDSSLFGSANASPDHACSAPARRSAAARSRRACASS